MIPPWHYEQLVRDALREDAPFGDPFGDALSGNGKGVFLARREGIFCGGPVAQEVFRRVAASVAVLFVPEGRRVAAAATAWANASGPVSALLRAERTALNFLARLSGVATATSLFAERIAPYGTRLLDTRKTTPLMRNLEKYAVRIGGGANHRFSLSDGILIKDNGIRAPRRRRGGDSGRPPGTHHLVKIEVEAETLAEVEEAVAGRADAVVLDNMKPATVREAVARFGGEVFLEASGGIHLGNVEEYASTGVAAIAVGAITHSAPAFDISFEMTS